MAKVLQFPPVTSAHREPHLLAALGEARWLRPDGQPEADWTVVTAGGWELARLAAFDVACIHARTRNGDSWARRVSWALLTAAERARCASLRAAIWERVYSHVSPEVRREASRAGEFDPWVIGNAAAVDAANYVVLRTLELEEFLPAGFASYLTRAWHVWRKGYALARDVEGELYVYTGRPASGRVAGAGA